LACLHWPVLVPGPEQAGFPAVSKLSWFSNWFWIYFWYEKLEKCILYLFLTVIRLPPLYKRKDHGHWVIQLPIVKNTTHVPLFALLSL
jgi:hypothetical protein